MRTFVQTWKAQRQAWRLLQGPLKIWMLPSALMTLGVAALGWWGISTLARQISTWLVSQGGWANESTWLLVGVEWSIWLVLFVVKLKVTKYVVLIVMGPLFVALSEAAEAQITGQAFPFSWSRWWRDSIRGMRSACILLVVEWTLVGVLFVAGLWLPFLSPLMVPVAWLVGAWAYGASVMDYVWEREGKGALGALAETARRPGVALGVGIPFALWMAVPVLAWTVGPMLGGLSAPVASVQALKGGVGEIPAALTADNQPATS